VTAAELAHHLGARAAGHGKWQARCPAHDDRSPSLSIAEGGDGRTLVHCWAGCSISAVLAAAGMSWRDMCGAPATPAERERLRRERAGRQRAERITRRRERARYDVLRGADTALDALAARLAAVAWCGAEGDLDALAERYHALLERTREAEVSHAA